MDEWNDWRESFLEKFGITLTMEWVAPVKGKFRRNDEIVRLYCNSEVKILREIQVER